MSRLVSNNVNCRINTQNSSDIKFKGKFTNSLQNTVCKSMGIIERGGFVTEFILVDFCGLVIPRTIQAFNRNREELGHPNYKAAIEEFLREILSGPTMILIPIAVMSLAKKMFNSSVHLPVKNFNALNDILKSTITNIKPKSSSLEIPPATEIKGEFFGNLFKNIFKDQINMVKNEKEQLTLKGLKHDTPLSQLNIDSEIQGFVDDIKKLTSEEKSVSSMTKAEKKTIVESIVDRIRKINETCGIKDNTKKVNLTFDVKESNIAVEAEHFIGDLVNFTNGTITKITNTFKESPNLFKDKKLLDSFFDKITHISIGARKAAVFTAFAATVTFLYLNPKIYQRYKTNPGVDGLIKSPSEPPKTAKEAK